MRTSIQACGQSIQQHFQSTDAEDYASHLQTYLLQQPGEGWHESKDAAVPDGAFGYRGDDEYVYAPWFGRCKERDDSNGGTGTGQKRSG